MQSPSLCDMARHHAGAARHSKVCEPSLWRRMAGLEGATDEVFHHLLWRAQEIRVNLRL